MQQKTKVRLIKRNRDYFWNSFTGADGDMLVKMVDKFNKENKDGIKVKMDISSVLIVSFLQHLLQVRTDNDTKLKCLSFYIWGLFTRCK